MSDDSPPLPKDAASWLLQALHVPEATEPMAITEDGLTIGRAASSDLVLVSDEFPGVSSTHARVVYRDGKVFVEDVNSKNGTFVGGESVRRVALEHGDVFELGRGGPRFVVLSPSRTDQTVRMSLDDERRRSRRDMGTETIEVMREKLGIPANTKVTEVVRRGHRRHTHLLFGVVVVLIAGGIWGALELRRSGQDVIDQLQVQLTAAKDAIETHRLGYEKRLDDMEAAHEKNWTKQKNALLEERKLLKAELKSASDTELNKLRKRLEENDKKLAQYDPVNLEQARLTSVNKVKHAVVLLEVRQRFIEPKTKRFLHVSRASGAFSPNLEDKGELYSQDSTGSGFCFDREGWILTNAHVVLKKAAKKTLPLRDLVLESHVDVQVVFHGTKERHNATVKAWLTADSKDLALVKIEPFAGMPHLDGIDVQLPEPPDATGVFLLGFPLGKRALQAGDTMIASAFRGIVSRSVKGYLQVDAAVHPGNSGGPLINDKGQVIGVVVGMQRIDGDLAATDMGYIIPIADATGLWPPKN